MKQLLSSSFPLPCLGTVHGQRRTKITLGEQTTADGLVFRGLAADTTRKPSVDTMAFILLDTNTNIIWQYKKATNNAWTRVGGSISTGVTGILPVANGGTGQTTLASALINTGNGTINFLPKYTATGTTIGNSAISDNGTTITATSRSFYNTGNNFIRVSNYFNIGGSGSDYGSIGFNIGYTNTNDNYKYLFGDLSSAIKFNGGGFNFLTAPSGTADSIIVYSERMRITNGGEIYVAGTTDRGAYNLQVNGTGVWGEGAYVNGSDANIKENIVDLDSSLNIVNNLKPVSFNYINTSVNNDTKHLGFIAQDIYQVLQNKDYLNSIVRSDGETLSIAYSNLIPLLTKAIQEQNALIKALEQRLLILENK